MLKISPCIIISKTYHIYNKHIFYLLNASRYSFKTINKLGVLTMNLALLDAAQSRNSSRVEQILNHNIDLTRWWRTFGFIS